MQSKSLLILAVLTVGLVSSVHAGTYETVTFTDAEEATVLVMANQATSTQLTADIGQTTTVAGNVIKARPITTMTQLASVAYVGASALNKFKTYVPKWGGSTETTTPPVVIAVTLDGVGFTAAEEAAALTIANTYTLEQLKTGGVATTPAGLIVNNRPWATLKAVSDRSGIATATMTVLRTMAQQTLPVTPTYTTTGGTFDGVVFTAEEEAKAIDICNLAGYSQLSPLPSTAKNTLYDKRPWSSVLAFSNTSGIGATAMTALKKMTATWTIGVSGRIDTVKMLKTAPPALNTGVRIPKCRIVYAAAGSTYILIADSNEPNYANPANHIKAYVPYGYGTLAASDPACQWYLTGQEINVKATYLLFPSGSTTANLRWENIYATHVTLADTGAYVPPAASASSSSRTVRLR